MADSKDGRSNKEADLVHRLYAVGATVSQTTVTEAVDAYHKSADEALDYDLPTAKELAKAQLIYWIDNVRSDDSKREYELYAELKQRGYARHAFVKGPRAASIRVRLSRKGYNAVVVNQNGAHVVAVALPTYTKADISDTTAAGILFP